MSTVKLMTCPFCGSTKILILSAYSGGVFVSCNGCTAEGPLLSNKYAAAESWNKVSLAVAHEDKVEPQWAKDYYEEDEE